MTHARARRMSRVAAVTSLLMAVVMLAFTPTVASAVAAPEAARARAAAAPLLGTWVGTYEGYYDGRYIEGQQRFVISKAREHAAKGTWQYRESSSKPWSTPKPVQFVVVPEADDPTLDVYGSDMVGTYAGELEGDVFELTYSEFGPKPQTLVFHLRRK